MSCVMPAHVGIKNLLHLVASRQHVLCARPPCCARLRFSCWADALRARVKLAAAPSPAITTTVPTCHSVRTSLSPPGFAVQVVIMAAPRSAPAVLYQTSCRRVTIAAVLRTWNLQRCCLKPGSSRWTLPRAYAVHTNSAELASLKVPSAPVATTPAITRSTSPLQLIWSSMRSLSSKVPGQGPCLCQGQHILQQQAQQI